MGMELYRDFEHTGPGTLAGRYMRTFWQPVFRAEDLSPGQAIPIGVMSENFTLYRGQGGTPHLVSNRCAHRGTQLSTGWVEEDTIRCRYHGWRYDGSGQCVEQPGEDASFEQKVKIRTYPVREYLGLIFAYLGKDKAPPFRCFPQFEGPGLLLTIPPEHWPCNYFNRLDNDPDPYHVVYTHYESVHRAQMQDRYTERRVSAEMTPYGVREMVRVPKSQIDFLHQYMPNVFQVRVRSGVVSAQGEDEKKVWEDRLIWAVPIDDENSYRFEIDLADVSGLEAEALEANRRAQSEISGDRLNWYGEEILAGKRTIEDLRQDLSTYEIFRVEDYVVQVGQGRIADRSKDHLVHLDVGVVLKRKLWERELQALAEGKTLTQWVIPTVRDDERRDQPQPAV